MKRSIIFLFYLLTLFSISPIYAQSYTGKVIDINGSPLPYATVYLIQDPAIGTATNNDGVFNLQTGVSPRSQIMVSYLGYEKQELTLADLLTDSIKIIRLKEQPLALEETIVSAKASKQKNKKKAIAQLLYSVYNQMQYDFSDDPYSVRLVSDVRMDANNQPWGMEQMIARVVTLPKEGRKERDSVQFAGEVCKRFFNTQIRSRANEIYQENILDDDILVAASAIDSGVVVHSALWSVGNVRFDFEKLMNDVKHWTVSNENEGETVLTHTEKHNFLGLFKINFKRHFIVDSQTYRIHSFSIDAEAQVSIPFGYKIRGEYLDLLNLLNMNNERIEKFRLRRAYAKVRLNTIYQNANGHLYPKEKNMVVNSSLTSTKKDNIPLHVQATQRVTSIETNNVRPMTKSEMTRRVERTIVEIY